MAAHRIATRHKMKKVVQRIQKSAVWLREIVLILVARAVAALGVMSTSWPSNPTQHQSISKQ